MIGLIAVLVVARTLAARAQRKGYPGFLATLGVLGWVAGETAFVAAGERFGVIGVLLADVAGGLAGALAAFAVIGLLPHRSRGTSIEAIEETFQ